MFVVQFTTLGVPHFVAATKDIEVAQNILADQAARSASEEWGWIIQVEEFVEKL